MRKSNFAIIKIREAVVLLLFIKKRTNTQCMMTYIYK